MKGVLAEARATGGVALGPEGKREHDEASGQEPERGSKDGSGSSTGRAWSTDEGHLVKLERNLGRLRSSKSDEGAQRRSRRPRRPRERPQG